MLPDSLGFCSERTGRARSIDARAGLSREFEAALPCGLALLFEKNGRVRRLDARTGLHVCFLFLQDKRHVALHTDETFGSGRNARNSANSGGLGQSKNTMGKKAREHEV